MGRSAGPNVGPKSWTQRGSRQQWLQNQAAETPTPRLGTTSKPGGHMSIPEAVLCRYRQTPVPWAAFQRWTLLLRQTAHEGEDITFYHP